MERASQLLSRLSRNVGFVLAPDIARTSFRHVDLVPLGHPRVLVVMVSATGLVTHKVIEVEERLEPAELQECANYLNAHFSGMPLAQIRARLMELMQEEKALYDSLLQRVLALGERAFAAPETRRERLPRRRLEHALAARVRGPRAHARPVPHLRGEGPAGADPERLHRGRGHPRPDRPREPRPRAARTCRSSPPPAASRASRASASASSGSTRMQYAHVVSLVDHVARAVADVLRVKRA